MACVERSHSRTGLMGRRRQNHVNAIRLSCPWLQVLPRCGRAQKLPAECKAQIQRAQKSAPGTDAAFCGVHRWRVRAVPEFGKGYRRKLELIVGARAQPRIQVEEASFSLDDDIGIDQDFHLSTGARSSFRALLRSLSQAVASSLPRWTSWRAAPRAAAISRPVRGLRTSGTMRHRDAVLVQHERRALIAGAIDAVGKVARRLRYCNRFLTHKIRLSDIA